ncbi:hypothetical protein CF327_g7007 [Tilletia walkeri]|nr:hypothetical protein CF327_g7007 [Tilletia walkeri]
MAEAEKFLCLSFYGTGQTKYGSLLMDRALIGKHLPELSETLRAAQVVNVHGRDDGWQGSDHFQELLNERIKSYDFDHKSDDAVNRIEDRISAFVGLGEELVDEMQECLGWNSRRRKKKEAIPEEDVQLLSADTKAHDLNAARGSGSSKTLRATALDEITSKKRSAAEQAQLVWEATSNLSAVNDCISKGYEYLVVNGLARFKDKQSDLQTRDRDVFDMATGRGSPTPREDGNDGNQEGETDGDFPDDEAVRLAEQEIVGEDKLGNDDEGSGSEDEDSDSN